MPKYLKDIVDLTIILVVGFLIFYFMHNYEINKNNIPNKVPKEIRPNIEDTNNSNIYQYIV